MGQIKIPANRFVCLIHREELDHIGLMLNGGIIKNSNDPDFERYREEFGLGFIQFKITIKDGYLHIEDPKQEHQMSDFWDNREEEEFKERVEFIESIDNWKDKILSELDPHAPDHFGLVNTGCGEPNALVIEQPEYMMPDWVQEKIENY